MVVIVFCLLPHVTLNLSLFPSGLDYVSHEDILPYNSTEQVPIQHELFERFLMYNPAKCKHSPPVSTLASNSLLHTSLYNAQWFTFHCSGHYEHISSHTEVIISHIDNNIYCQVKYSLYCLHVMCLMRCWYLPMFDVTDSYIELTHHTVPKAIPLTLVMWS